MGVDRKRNCLLILFFLAPFMFLTLFATAQFDILFSTDEDFYLGSFSILAADENLIKFSAGSFVINSMLPPASLPQEVNIDAIGRLSPNEIVFSLDEDAMLPGLGVVADEDLIRYDGSSFTLWWDGSSAGLPPEVNLDAVHILDSSSPKFYFSLEEDAVLPGAGLVADEDIIYFDGSNFVLAIDGSSIGIPAEAGIDALGIIPNTSSFVFSLDSAAWLNGVLYDDGDLIEWTGSIFLKLFDASTQGMPVETDINAVEVLGRTELPDWLIFGHH